MNGTARANARNEVVGNPGSMRRRLEPRRVDEHQRDREDERRDRHRRLAERALDRAARDRPDLDRGRARRSRVLRLLGALRASVPVFARNTSSSVGARSSTSSSAIALRVEPADDVGEADRPSRAVRRGRRSPSGSPYGPRSSTIRASSCDRAAIAWTLGRPISALRSVGVPSATMRPWSMIPTRSASTSASSRYWVVRNTVTPSSRASRADLLPERRAALRIETGRRLVEEEDARPVDEREREVEPPLHPAGVAADLAVGRLGEADALEQLVRARAGAPRAAGPGASSGAGGGRGR